jgi:hypothetical protein
MTDFMLPRAAVPARVHLCYVKDQAGHIFVGERAQLHSGPETPLEMLNREEGFFPFRPEKDQGVLLVAKGQTISVSIGTAHLPAADPDRRSAAKRLALTLTLADGTILGGWATVELPEFHSRPLDYLNRSLEPFFELATDTGVHYVNRAQVLYARPGD